MTLLLLCSVAFVAMGLWMAAMPAASSPWLSRGLGAVGVLFFGACGYVACKKLIDTQPGLIVDARGLTDNSSGVSAGRLLWTDVAAVQPSFVAGQKFVSLILHDPQAYLQTHAQRNNTMQKKLGEMNMKLVGTPVSVSANSLQLSFDELLDLLQTYHRHSQDQ